MGDTSLRGDDSYEAGLLESKVDGSVEEDKKERKYSFNDFRKALAEGISFALKQTGVPEDVVESAKERGIGRREMMKLLGATVVSAGAFLFGGHISRNLFNGNISLGKGSLEGEFYLGNLDEFLQRSRNPSQEQYLRFIGGFPNRQPLELKIIEEENMGDGSGMVLQKVEYNVGEERVVSNLLIPPEYNRKPKAILCFPPYGWSKDDLVDPRKSPGSYGIGLARKGYYTLSLDGATSLKGFREFEEWEGPSQDIDLNDDYLVAARAMQKQLLFGMSRGVDVLQLIPGVSPEKIGCIGHSIGGTQTTFLTALDPRIKVAVSNCGISTYQDILRYNGDYDEQGGFIPDKHFTGLFGFWEKERDLDQLVTLIPPRPFLIISGGERDRGFPIQGVKKCYKRMLPLYGENSERVNVLNHRGGHDFNSISQLASERWFNQWL